MDNFEWTVVYRVLHDLDRSLLAAGNPGHFPGTLQIIELLIDVIHRADFEKVRCAELLMLARQFYGAKPKNPFTPQQAEAAHREMLERVTAMGAKIQLMKDPPPAA